MYLNLLSIHPVWLNGIGYRVSGAFKSNEGYWKFEPIDKGKFTLVTYSKYVDGGILFPQFLVKKELRSNMRLFWTN